MESTEQGNEFLPVGRESEGRDEYPSTVFSAFLNHFQGISAMVCTHDGLLILLHHLFAEQVLNKYLGEERIQILLIGLITTDKWVTLILRSVDEELLDTRLVGVVIELTLHKVL